MEMDDQPVCTEEDLAVMNELEAAACAAETSAVSVPIVGTDFSRSASVGKIPDVAAQTRAAELRWVGSIMASNKVMNTTIARSTDEWWRAARKGMGRMVCYEIIPNDVPVMPYGDIDVKLGKLVPTGSPFLTKQNMVALSTSLCLAILPAMTTFAERAPWATQGHRPEIMLFAAPGQDVVSAHWLIRNVRHFKSQEDVRACAAEPMAEVLINATDEWRRTAIAMAASVGADVDPEKLRDMMRPDRAVYKNAKNAWQKWRTPFASKEEQDRPFLYFDPEEDDKLVAAHEMNESSPIHKRCHVTTVGVYEAERAAFSRPNEPPTTAVPSSRRTKRKNTEPEPALPVVDQTTQYPVMLYENMEWLIDQLPPMCSEKYDEWLGNVAAVHTEASRAGAVEEWTPLALKIAHLCSPGKWDAAGTLSLYGDIHRSKPEKMRTVGSLIMVAQNYAAANGHRVQFSDTLKLKMSTHETETVSQMPPKLTSTPKPAPPKKQSDAFCLAWEVAKSVMGAELKAFGCEKGAVESVNPQNPPHALEFSLRHGESKVEHRQCPMCNVAHERLGFVVNLWIQNARAEVRCFHTAGGVKQMLCGAALGPTSARLWPVDPRIPEGVQAWLRCFKIKLPALDHPWIQRTNPMYIAAALFPTPKHKLYGMNQVINHIKDNVVNRPKSNADVKMAFLLPLSEWARFCPRAGVVWYRQMQPDSIPGKWQSNWNEIDSTMLRRNINAQVFLQDKKSKKGQERTESEKIIDLITDSTSPFAIEGTAFLPYSDFKRDRFVADEEESTLNTFDRLSIMSNDVSHIEIADALKESRSFWWHVLHRMCGDDRKVYDFVVDWLAFILQRCQRSEAMVGMYSTQGTGKGRFVQKIIDILGDRMCFHCCDTNRILSRFNFSLANKLLVFMDECLVSDKRAAANDLKGKITEPTVNIEKKFHEVTPDTNRMNFVFATNNDNPIHIESNDRRALLLYVSDELSGAANSAEARAAIRDLNAVSPEAIARVLYAHKLPEGRLSHAIPRTEAKWRETVKSLSPMEQFLFQLYKSGDNRLFPAPDSSGRQRFPPMAARVVELIQKNRASRPEPEHAIRNLLIQQLGVAVVKRSEKEEFMMLGAHIGGRGAFAPNDMDPPLPAGELKTDRIVERWVFDTEKMRRRWHILIDEAAYSNVFDPTPTPGLATAVAPDDRFVLTVEKPHKQSPISRKSLAEYNKLREEAGPEALYDKDGYPLPVGADWDVFAWRDGIYASHASLLLESRKSGVPVTNIKGVEVDECGNIKAGLSADPAFACGADLPKTCVDSDVKFDASIRFNLTGAEVCGKKRPRGAEIEPGVFAESDDGASSAPASSQSSAKSSQSSATTSQSSAASQEEPEVIAAKEPEKMDEWPALPMELDAPVCFEAGPVRTGGGEDNEPAHKAARSETGSRSSAGSASSSGVVNIADPKYTFPLLYLRMAIEAPGQADPDISDAFRAEYQKPTTGCNEACVNVTDLAKIVSGLMVDQLNKGAPTVSPPSTSSISRAMSAFLRQRGWESRQTTRRDKSVDGRSKSDKITIFVNI